MEGGMDESPSFGAWLKPRRQALELTQAAPGQRGGGVAACRAARGGRGRRRRAVDLPQDALARLVGCSVVSIRKFEGDEQRPSCQLADLLAAQLQIPPPERQAVVQ